MLSFEQEKIIRQELSQPTADEFVKRLLAYYSNDLEKLNLLLSYIPKLAEKSLNMKQKEINRYSWSTDLLVAERYHYPLNKRKARKNSDYNPDFPALLYTCLAHIDLNTVDAQSVAVKAFFEEFVDALKNKRGFDYEKTGDWNWLDNVANGSQYVTKVVRSYIDKDFVPPCN